MCSNCYYLNKNIISSINNTEDVPTILMHYYIYAASLHTVFNGKSYNDYKLDKMLPCRCWYIYNDYISVIILLKFGMVSINSRKIDDIVIHKKTLSATIDKIYEIQNKKSAELASKREIAKIYDDVKLLSAGKTPDGADINEYKQLVMMVENILKANADYTAPNVDNEIIDLVFFLNNHRA